MSYIQPARLAVPCFDAPVPAGVTRTPPSLRSEHAHLLDVAAARRLRAVARREESRFEDADYWKACAPVALRKAVALRAWLNALP